MNISFAKSDISSLKKATFTPISINKTPKFSFNKTKKQNPNNLNNHTSSVQYGCFIRFENNLVVFEQEFPNRQILPPPIKKALVDIIQYSNYRQAAASRLTPHNIRATNHFTGTSVRNHLL